MLITKEGKQKIEERLRFLKTTKNDEITEKIKIAREFGDLSENAEYKAAKEEQELLFTEINSLEQQLNEAQIVDQPSVDNKKHITVAFDSIVTFEIIEEKKQKTLKIVEPIEADILKQKISSESPVGKALFGLKQDDIVKIKTLSGPKTLKIIKIEKESV